MGNVLLKARYATSRDNAAPLDVVFVVDETYSMRWGWQGNGNPVDAQHPSRLDVMKQQLTRFVDEQLLAGDRMAIVGFGEGLGSTGRVLPYPADKTYTPEEIDAAMTALTRVHAPYTPGDGSGKAMLKAAVAGLRSQGNTATALGLLRARREIVANSRTTALVNGSLVPVRKLLVLVTDGVANVYLDGKFARCPDGQGVSELCVPHLASPGQPIDQMVRVAEQAKQDIPRLEVSVVAMSYQFDVTGLNRVSSDSDAPSFNRADEVIDMAPIFNALLGSRASGTRSCLALEEPYGSRQSTTRGWRRTGASARSRCSATAWRWPLPRY